MEYHFLKPLQFVCKGHPNIGFMFEGIFSNLLTTFLLERAMQCVSERHNKGHKKEDNKGHFE